MQPPLGTRVVLRFRRPAGSVPSQSDVIGILESLTPEVSVRTASGELSSVPTSAVVVLKSIPPKPVRTSSIRKLERAAAYADTAVECEWVAGWVARAVREPGAGSGALANPGALANSAVPLADPSMPEGGYYHDLCDEPTMRALAAWYAARSLPLQLRLPDRLVRPPASWGRFDERLVLAVDLAELAVDAEELADGELVDGDRVLLGREEGDEEPQWAGLVLGPTASDLPSRIKAQLGEAARRGASRAYLEVPAAGEDAAGENAVTVAARALGFGDHHRARHVRLEFSDPS